MGVTGTWPELPEKLIALPLERARGVKFNLPTLVSWAAATNLQKLIKTWFWGQGCSADEMDFIFSIQVGQKGNGLI